MQKYITSPLFHVLVFYQLQTSDLPLIYPLELVISKDFSQLKLLNSQFSNIT